MKSLLKRWYITLVFIPFIINILTNNFDLSKLNWKDNTILLILIVFRKIFANKMHGMAIDKELLVK